MPIIIAFIILLINLDYISYLIIQTADKFPSTVVKAQTTTLPVKRIGTAAEAARCILLLMTTGFITGEVLHLDGGGRYV